LGFLLSSDQHPTMSRERHGSGNGNGNGAPREGVQSELDDLQRKYRMMEINRRSYTEDSQNTIRMQRQQIDKLKKDNERLKEDLALETRQAKQANNMSASAQIAKLQDQGDTYTRKIEAEKRRIEELDKSIKKLQGNILQQRKDMGGINASRENNQQVQKQIRILENRLDKALVKFNEALAHNKALRETIDNLRRERVVFDGIYTKLERELQEKKSKMAQIIEISNAAYSARDKAQAEMVQLKEQADREQMNFEVEWSQLNQLIEKDRKLKDFIKSKERERSSKAGDPALEEEQKLRKKVTKGAWGIAKDKANIHLSMEKVQSYEEAFAKIQKATKISDIDELVATFIQAEDQNFSLFNYVNDLSGEIEKLEDSIAEVKEEIQKYRGQGVGTDNQRKVILEDLEQKLTKTESQAVVYEDKHAVAQRTVNSLKNGIASIIKRIGGTHPLMNEMLNSAGVTESNMMQYLGLIEERTNELLAKYHQQQQNGQLHNTTTINNNNNISTSNTRPSTGNKQSAFQATIDYSPSAVTIDAPTAGSYSDDEGDEGEDDVPIFREDIERQRAY